jgi:hypothetical protein
MSPSAAWFAGAAIVQSHHEGERKSEAEKDDPAGV